MSDRMWFQRVKGDPQGFNGFWMCPTANCGGAGFTFDIFPTDPDHPANAGWVTCDDDDDDEGEDGEGDEEDDDDDDDDDEYLVEGEDDEEVAGGASADPPGAEGEWDPDETKYKELDEEFGDEDDDIEGEEWKYGLEPGQRPPEPPWAAEARQRWEEEQKKYDEPDERPREVDWTDRDDGRGRAGESQPFGDEDIPF
jgi:hypothetical protein